MARHSEPSNKGKVEGFDTRKWTVGRSILMLLLTLNILAIVVLLVIHYEYYGAVSKVVSGVWGAVTTLLAYVGIKKGKIQSLSELFGFLPVKMIIITYTILIYGFLILSELPIHKVVITSTLDGEKIGRVDIYWDQDHKGKTSAGKLPISWVKRGYHKLEGKLDGHPDYRRDSTYVGIIRTSVGVRFFSRTGNIHIQSDPSGAEIWIDGDPKETETPATLYDLSVGIHALELRKHRYHDKKLQVYIREGDTDTVIVLDPILGSIDIRSDPRDAEVYLDGKWTNKRTRCTIDGLSMGTYQLELKRPRDGDYADFWQGTIEISGSSTLEIYGELKPVKLHALTIRSDPSGAEIYIDGKQTGFVTPRTVKVIKGEHTITLRRAEYQDRDWLVRVPEQTMTETIRLQEVDN